MSKPPFPLSMLENGEMHLCVRSKCFVNIALRWVGTKYAKNDEVCSVTVSRLDYQPPFREVSGRVKILFVVSYLGNLNKLRGFSRLSKQMKWCWEFRVFLRTRNFLVLHCAFSSRKKQNGALFLIQLLRQTGKYMFFSDERVR